MAKFFPLSAGMTGEEIIAKGKWITKDLLDLHLHCPHLNKEVLFEIGFDHNDPEKNLSENAVKSVNEFLEMKKEDWEWIARELFDHSQEHLMYGGWVAIRRKKGQSNFEANRDFFGLYTQEDALNQSELVLVSTANDTPYSIFVLLFKVSWDFDNKVSFVFIDGKKHHME